MSVTETRDGSDLLRCDDRSNEQVLAEQGWDFQRFEALSRKASADGLHAEGITLPEQDRFDACAAFVLGHGLAFARRFDPERANGLSFSTACYRRMRRRVVDWLRTRVDYRYGGQGISEHVTSDGELPEAPTVDVGSVEQALVEIARSLKAAGSWTEEHQRTLVHICQPLAEGFSLWRAAHNAGIDPFEAQLSLQRLESAMQLARSA